MIKGACRIFVEGLKKTAHAKPSKVGFFDSSSQERFHQQWKAFKESSPPAVTPLSADDQKRINEELKLAEESRGFSNY